MVMLAAGMVMSATAFSLFADDRVRLLWYVAAFLPHRRISRGRGRNAVLLHRRGAAGHGR